MVFNVSRSSILSFVLVRWLDSLELCHDLFHGLSHYISQNAKSTSVRHADNEITGTVIDSSVNSYFESWNETFASFKSKTFHSVKLLTKEGPELVSPVQSVVEMEFFFFIHSVVLDTFEVDTDPILNFSVRDV